MWETIGPAQAIYGSPADHSRSNVQPNAVPCLVSVEGPGGSQGWQMACRFGREATAGAKDDPIAKFQIRPLSTKTMPRLSESYFRGEDFILNYAQQETDSFGLSLQVTPIECSERTTVVQLTISLQTDLLDSHPSIELLAAAESTADASASPALVGPRRLGTEGGESIFGSVSLDPRDQRAAIDSSDEETLRVQLFGNFLEKGVIRKSRPWIVFWRGLPPARDEIEALYQRLCETPLPLTT